MRPLPPRCPFVTVLLLAWTLALPAQAMDDTHWQAASQAIQKGIEFLRSTQLPDGSWTPAPGPAVTAMVLGAMLDQPNLSATDPAVEKALAYVMSMAKPDGSIHNGQLENYNTAICLSALARVTNRPDVAAVVKKAQDFLKASQWQDGMTDPAGVPVNQDHPYYGGFGYGKHGRPDGSNLQFAIQALHDSGVSCDDPVFQRAVTYVSRLQGLPSNTMFGDVIEPGGGAIYATSINKEQIGKPQTFADTYTDEQGQTRLRATGSMTYAMLKTYIYANLSRDDQRVTAALDWIRRNYTLEGNPGNPPQRAGEGHFYYLVTFGRTLKAWGASSIAAADGKSHDWASDLVAKLTSLQLPDGSWKNPRTDRFMEQDANLATAYALISLTAAIR